LIGICQTAKRVITRETYNKKKIKTAKHNSSREFISLLATICADSTKIPLALIYKGKTNSLQDTWTIDIREEEVYFSASTNRWSSNKFGIAYLTQVFDLYTRTKAIPRGTRLLIVDGHSSHINLAFLEKYKKLRIYVLILPPHSTQRLQPYDVGVFLPLSTEYSKLVSLLLYKSDGVCGMSKRLFYGLFKKT
jgi:hypothetical protein